MKKTFKAAFEAFIYPIFIILFNITGLSIINPIAKCIGNTNLIYAINDSSTRVAVDSAIIALIVNVILLIANKPVKISGSLKPKNYTDKVIISLDSRKVRSKAELELKVDYKFKLFKWILLKIGGTSLIIHNTDFTSMQIENRSSRLNGASTMISSKELQIKLESSVQERYCSGDSRLIFTLEPDVSETECGKITTEIRPLVDKNRKIAYMWSKIICSILISKKIEDLEVQVVRDSD